MKIVTLFRMISSAVSNTSTIRSVFIIDDKLKIRSILIYLKTLGRYITEIIRIFDYLQMDKAVTPTNLLHGAPRVVPPPQTYQQLKERVQNPIDTPESRCSIKYQSKI